MRRYSRFVAFVMVLSALACAAPATEYSLTPADNWLGVINGEGLQPGDTVLLGSGTYITPDDVTLNIAHVGTAAAPITIKAAPGAHPIITRNTFGRFDDYYQNLQHNVINMRGAQYVTLDGLEITGGNWGIRIGDKTTGVSNGASQPMGDILRAAGNITVQNCNINHTHNTAVSANFPGEVYSGLTFRHNEISYSGRYGEAFYLGNYDDASVQTFGIVKNSVVANNYIHDQVWVNSWYQDPIGPSYHGTGIQLKDGSYNNQITDNVIQYTRYPGILISGAESQFGARGTAGWGPNVINGNVIWQISQAPSDITGQGMQIASDAVITNNVVYAPRPFYTNNHPNPLMNLCGNLQIVNNTFISTGSDVIYFADAPSNPVLIANNALYRGEGNPNVITGVGASDPDITKSGNVTILNLSTALANAAALNFWPTATSPLLNAADPAYQMAADFNGTLRGSDLTVGAYAYLAGGNPGWAILGDFKPVVPEPATLALLASGVIPLLGRKRALRRLNAGC